MYPSKNREAERLRQFAADTLTHYIPEGMRVFYHGTSASEAEAVMETTPKEPRGIAVYHLDLGDRFYTSEDIAVVAD